MIYNNTNVSLVLFTQVLFSKAAPELWNALPLDLRKSKSIGTFKKALKTHLFSLAYGQ